MSHVVPKASAPESLSRGERKIVARFHRLYYNRWRSGAPTIDLSWFGVRLLKCPMDLWMYQELLWRVRADLVVETGTLFGGSALFLAHMCVLMGEGRILTIDKELVGDRPAHPRITYLLGSSTDDSTVMEVARYAAEAQRVMVILDSDHKASHVLEEMRRYADFVTLGSYLIVEDTNVNGHPVYPEFGPGPSEAVEAFLAGRDDFVMDHDCERFLMTLNPGGYLRRKEPAG